MLYTYASQFGQFALVRAGAQWHVEFNEVPIGQQYASAEHALVCLVRGCGFGGTLSELIAVARVPASLAHWTHVSADPEAAGSLRAPA